MKKNLGNGARKILDSANSRLAAILNENFPIRLKERNRRKRLQKIADDANQSMEEDGEEKSESDKDGDMKEEVADTKSKKSNDKDDESIKDDENKESDKDSSSDKSDSYGGEQPEEEDEQELFEMEMARQTKLKVYVEDLSDEILLSNIPEEQKHLLVKILTK